MARVAQRFSRLCVGCISTSSILGFPTTFYKRVVYQSTLRVSFYEFGLKLTKTHFDMKTKSTVTWAFSTVGWTLLVTMIVSVFIQKTFEILGILDSLGWDFF